MTNSPRIVRGRTELYVPTGAGELMYTSPAVGPQTYQNVGKQILESKMSVPTGDLTAPLVHATYCSDAKNEPEFANVRQITQNNWLWVYNRNLWTDKGLFSVQDLEALGRSQPLDVKKLEQKIKGKKSVNGVIFGDDGVRFAEKGSYAFGEMSPEKLAKDGAMIAQYGVRGAELMAEASANLRNKPITYGLDIPKGIAPELRVSGLLEDGSRLLFGGVDFFDDGDFNCAFPVSAPSAQKI